MSKPRGKIYQSQQMEQWITKELETTELGDIRRTKRLMKIVENLTAKPEASVPHASGTWAATKATYDFWNSPDIKPSMIRLLTYSWDSRENCPA
ncbi:IS4/Tn5 family transposase DNA-binding protein [Nostoc sp.]|uniref:IS4/Tn5 family transposase DNA-binding protein n=1 Tax=Nostoc sp. TaxID=1180 RepID=UPI002FFB3410